MKKYLFLFSAILTVSGCFSLSPTFQEREHERIYSAINGKRFYIVKGKGYACTVEGPFEAEVTDRNDIRLRDLETGSLLYSRDEPRIREFFFSQLKMNQTITSESQFRTALVPGGCRCVWHVADGIEHYDAVIEKTVLDKELPIIKKAFDKAKKIANEKKAKDAAEKKRKAEQKAAEKKRKAEQEAAKKNNEVLDKYGKPYCDPFKVLSDNTVSGGSFAERKRDCLFRYTFHVSQVVDDGMLVYDRKQVCEGYIPYTYCHNKDSGPYFVIKNEADREKVDDDDVSGLFEYVGPYTYHSLFGAPRTVLRYKHVE